MPSIYDFTMKSLTGEDVSLEKFRGKVLLIVNVASKCGLTSQYEGLEAIYRKYKDRGFEVLGFPCNQFGGQEPGTESEIAQFCTSNYGVDFPMFAKIDVNGADQHPLYTFLKNAKGGIFGDAIKWNFAKFLINREGNVVERYAPTTGPASVADDIERLLG